MRFKVIQGDSFAYDLERTDGELLDATWRGNWAVVRALGDKPLVGGAMVLSADQASMELRISPEECGALAPGDYLLVAQIENAELAYRHEVLQAPFAVTAQGIAG